MEDVAPDVAPSLIERGALVDIWAAVGLNDIERTRELLEQDPSLITAPGGDGKHPLHYAQDVEMVNFLVGHGADVNARCIDHGSTPLQYLIRNRDVVFQLLDHGAEPDIFMAAYWGAVAQAKTCVAANAECCNARVGDGTWTSLGQGDIYKWSIRHGHDATPLQVARSRGHADLVDLIAQHASPTTKLTDAIWRGNRAAVDIICTGDEDVLNQLIASEPNAMTRAAWEYNPSAVKLMLELGFDPHQVGVHASSPLDRAAFHDYDDIIELLLQHDPDPPIHGKNEFGGTPLAACLHGLNHGWKTGHPQDHVRTVRLLLEVGSAVNKQFVGQGNSEIDRLIKERLA